MTTYIPGLRNYAATLLFSVICLLTAPMFTCASEGRNSPAIIIDFSGQVERSGVPSPWKLRIKEGAAYARIVADGGEPALYLRSLSSSFSLEREVMLSIRQYPFLNWTWKALTIPPRGDLRKRSRNDQVLQVLVAFEGGRILSYVWDSNAPEGTVSDESIGIPLFIRVKVIVVKSGIYDTGKWLTMSRNLYDDYKRTFNEEPRQIQAIRVQTNSQYTGDCAEGLVRRLVFSRSL